MDTISPVYARLILRELDRREIDPAPLFAGTALSRQELLRGGDIAVEDFLHILRTGDGLLGDEQLGFMLGDPNDNEKVGMIPNFPPRGCIDI